MQEFITIPFSLIANRDFGDKRVLVYASILFSDWDGKNIEELVSYSRFSTRRDSGSVLHQYKILIQQLIQNQYLIKDETGIRCRQFCDSFGIIKYEEFERILQARDKSVSCGFRINHSHILLLLAHIRLWLVRQSNGHAFYSNLLTRISNSIGVSVRNITKSLKVLEELNIVYSQELPRYKDSSGRWHSNTRVFINMESDVPDYNWHNEATSSIIEILKNIQNNTKEIV